MEHEIIRLEREISDIRADQATVVEQIKSIVERLDKQDEILKAVNELALSVRDLSNAQVNTKEKVDSLCTDMATMKSKPAKRWESLVEKALSASVGGLIAYILLKLGIG